MQYVLETKYTPQYALLSVPPHPSSSSIASGISQRLERTMKWLLILAAVRSDRSDRSVACSSRSLASPSGMPTTSRTTSSRSSPNRCALDLSFVAHTIMQQYVPLPSGRRASPAAAGRSCRASACSARGWARSSWRRRRRRPHHRPHHHPRPSPHHRPSRRRRKTARTWRCQQIAFPSISSCTVEGSGFLPSGGDGDVTSYDPRISDRDDADVRSLEEEDREESSLRLRSSSRSWLDVDDCSSDSVSTGSVGDNGGDDGGSSRLRRRAAAEEEEEDSDTLPPSLYTATRWRNVTKKSGHFGRDLRSPVREEQLEAVSPVSHGECACV